MFSQDRLWSNRQRCLLVNLMTLDHSGNFTCRIDWKTRDVLSRMRRASFFCFDLLTFIVVSQAPRHQFGRSWGRTSNPHRCVVLGDQKETEGGAWNRSRKTNGSSQAEGSSWWVAFPSFYSALFHWNLLDLIKLEEETRAAEALFEANQESTRKSCIAMKALHQKLETKREQLKRKYAN